MPCFFLFVQLCRDKTKIRMSIVRPPKADLSHITDQELAAVQKLIEARVQTQQKEILNNSKSSKTSKPKSRVDQLKEAPTSKHVKPDEMSPATRHIKAEFAHNNRPRARHAAPPAAKVRFCRVCCGRTVLASCSVFCRILCSLRKGVTMRQRVQFHQNASATQD